MRIKEGDEWKTAFKTRYGHFEYQVMPFGLLNTSAINKILAKKLDIFVIVYLNNVLVYTENKSQGHVEAVQWVLDLLQKNGFFANLKKCRFHQDEVRFLGYAVSAQGVQIEDKKIETTRNWLEPKSVRDIQVFLDFANFYWRFIQGLSKIAGPLTLMLQITGSSKNLPSSMDMAESDEVSTICGGGNCEDKTVKRLLSKNSNGAIDYLTPKTRLALTKLRKAFTKALILWHLDSEYYIWIKTNMLGYAIGGVLSQLTLDYLGQWHLVAFYSQKMIPAETWYKTHDGKLLAIIKAFKK